MVLLLYVIVIMSELITLSESGCDSGRSIGVRGQPDDVPIEIDDKWSQIFRIGERCHQHVNV